MLVLAVALTTTSRSAWFDILFPIAASPLGAFRFPGTLMSRLAQPPPAGFPGNRNAPKPSTLIDDLAILRYDTRLIFLCANLPKRML